jgi:hypothetical protein
VLAGPEDEVEYEHVLRIYRADGTPILLVTSEGNQLAARLGSRSPFLCAIDEDGHHNLGSEDRWADLKAFAEQAIEVATERTNGGRSVADDLRDGTYCVRFEFPSSMEVDIVNSRLVQMRDEERGVRWHAMCTPALYDLDERFDEQRMRDIHAAAVAAFMFRVKPIQRANRRLVGKVRSIFSKPEPDQPLRTDDSDWSVHTSRLTVVPGAIDHLRYWPPRDGYGAVASPVDDTQDTKGGGPPLRPRSSGDKRVHDLRRVYRQHPQMIPLENADKSAP